MPETNTLSTLREIESLAGHGLSDAEMEREANAILERAAEAAKQTGGVKAAVSELEAVRQTLADTLAHQPASGPLLSAYTYAANGIKPLKLKLTEPKH
jgi:hypothetical protein